MSLERYTVCVSGLHQGLIYQYDTKATKCRLEGFISRCLFIVIVGGGNPLRLVYK